MTHPLPETPALDLAASMPAPLDAGAFKQKQYPSHYLSLAQRRALIDRLVEEAGTEIQTDVRLVRLDGGSADGKVSATVRSGNNVRLFDCSAAAVATGRLGPLDWSTVLPSGPTRFQRLEVGVRIEHRPDVGPLADVDATDVKLVMDVGSSGQCRTFCSCRDGAVVPIQYLSHMAYSGRADGPPTGRSNFGVNLRLTSEEAAKETWSALIAAQVKSPLAPVTKLEHALGTGAQGDSTHAIAEYFGPTWPLLQSAIAALCKDFPSLHDDATLVYAPTIEGTGHYPATDNQLRHQPLPVWVAGDATGRFRGNTASLVSGYYVGMQIAKQFGV